MTTPHDVSPVADPLQDLLTLDEVVAWLRVPRSWVYEPTRKGQIPHLKLGKYLRFPRQALAQWLATRSGLGSLDLYKEGNTYEPTATEGRRQDGAQTENLTGPLSEDLWVRLKVAAAEAKIDVSALICQVMEEYLKGHKGGRGQWPARV